MVYESPIGPLTIVASIDGALLEIRFPGGPAPAGEPRELRQ